MTDKRVFKLSIAAFLLLGVAAACFARKEETLPQLIARAEAAKKRAEERLVKATVDMDFERARIALLKSLIRLQVASRARIRS